MLRCDHERRKSAAGCIEDIIGENNSEHFFVATQDADLRMKFREVWFLNDHFPSISILIKLVVWNSLYQFMIIFSCLFYWIDKKNRAFRSTLTLIFSFSPFFCNLGFWNVALMECCIVLWIPRKLSWSGIIKAYRHGWERIEDQRLRCDHQFPRVMAGYIYYRKGGCLKVPSESSPSIIYF